MSSGSNGKPGVAKQGVGEGSYTPAQKATTGKYGKARPSDSGQPVNNGGSWRKAS